MCHDPHSAIDNQNTFLEDFNTEAFACTRHERVNVSSVYFTALKRVITAEKFTIIPFREISLAYSMNIFM